VLRAGTGDAGQNDDAQGIGAVAGDSMIGRCGANDQAGSALDVGQEPVRFENPLLPETRSEMALATALAGQVIGAMTVQSAVEAAFDEADIAVMQTMPTRWLLPSTTLGCCRDAGSAERDGSDPRQYLREA